MKITHQMHARWKEDPVTIEVMAVLETMLDDVQEHMINPDLIENSDSRAKLHRLLGYSEGIQEVLNIDSTLEYRMTLEQG